MIIIIRLDIPGKTELGDNPFSLLILFLTGQSEATLITDQSKAKPDKTDQSEVGADPV